MNFAYETLKTINMVTAILAILLAVTSIYLNSMLPRGLPVPLWMKSVAIPAATLGLIAVMLPFPVLSKVLSILSGMVLCSLLANRLQMTWSAIKSQDQQTEPSKEG